MLKVLLICHRLYINDSGPHPNYTETHLNDSGPRQMANEPTLMTQDLSQMTWEAIATASENVIRYLNKNGSAWTELGMQYLVGTVSANEIDPWKKFMLRTHCMPGTCKKESHLLHKWRQHDSFETQTIKMIYRKTLKNERNASEASFPRVSVTNFTC